ncbi:phage tail family protein [Eubacteriales bacterium OttesenSCG-928-A19]|nr:phage tail family protein [Eubacteriales bacterium OttesenSCG-928-A19]
MGFLYNGITSQSMRIRARLTDWQASPSLRNAYVTVPGRPGIVDFGTTTAEKIITVRCNIFPQRDFTALVTVLDAMVEWLNPEYGLKQLVMDDVPDRYFEARLTEAVDCERILSSAGGFDLRFICPDPHGYALIDEVYTLSEAGSHTIRREKGNTASEPVYLLKGIIPAGAGTYVSIDTNELELRIVGPLAEGETLMIDSGLMTAKVVDAQGETLRNGLPCLQSLNFPTLHKGANTLVITTAGATFSELTIHAESRWR